MFFHRTFGRNSHMQTRNLSVAICLAVMMSLGLTAQAQQKAKPGVSEPPKVDSGGLSVSVPLTVDECNGLGGSITTTPECMKAGQFTCTTTTINAAGTIKSHAYCIDKP